MRRTLRLPANSWSVWVREVLSVPDPGTGLSVLGASEDIVKGAAVRFVEELVFRLYALILVMCSRRVWF